MRTPRSPFPAPSVRSRIVRLTAFSIISEMRWTGTERRLRTPRCSSWWGVVGLPNSRTASVRAVLICGFLRTVMVHQVYPVHHLRSEEHTSELQSHSDLVCRLLLEKKKNKPPHDRVPTLFPRSRG